MLTDPEALCIQQERVHNYIESCKQFSNELCISSADFHGLHLRWNSQRCQELVVATAVQELSLSTFDGLLGLGLPGIAHVQQDN